MRRQEWDSDHLTRHGKCVCSFTMVRLVGLLATWTRKPKRDVTSTGISPRHAYCVDLGQIVWDTPLQKELVSSPAVFPSCSLAPPEHLMFVLSNQIRDSFIS